jgi:hypothetical protein
MLATLASVLVVLASSPASPGPTLAREDTMHTEVPEVLVSAPRVTLDEIIDRVARGEARRDSMLQDQAFTATFRVVRNQEKKPAALVIETVTRVFRKRPHRARTVTLRTWREEGGKGKVDIRFRSEMDEEIVNFAFRPAARRDFKYHIVGRDLVGNHVVYRIAFSPRSPLDPSLPSGLVWVDTNDFVIVRQEVSFERSPVPLFVKGVDRMVIERRQVDGHWVLWRVLMRAQTSVPIPHLGRSFDLTLIFDQYAINSGLADSLFTGKGGS